MPKQFKRDSPVENQNQKNEEICSELSYINSSQEETHQMKNHQISPSLEDSIPSGKTLSLIEDKPSSHKEQNIKINNQLFSNVNYFSIQKEDKIKAINEHQECNTKNENMTQVEEFNSPIYVRIGWEEYPVMAIMNPNIEENILPLKIGLSIGMKPKKKNKTKHKRIMKKVQVIMPTDETVYLPFTVEGATNFIILGKEFCSCFNFIKNIHEYSIEVEESTNLKDNEMNEEEEEKYSNMFSFRIFNN
ncbi:hypothetical protein O181_127218 [Austropuccinia psidii MF-1]|uniref:Uncharacterized protein n=1 Tax=Austropuccinia psidii MF-1 TaxID=1389203 RepID=A0A9Q3KSS2_9BASI|nr:hypothetical protein [Austropuccinia psidii MF-1]